MAVPGVLLFAIALLGTSAVPISDTPQKIEKGDIILVEVYDSPDGSGKLLGYLQSCENPGSEKDPKEGHMCAYKPTQHLTVGSQGDPPSLGSISFNLPGTDDKGDPVVACPCDYPGNVPWYPAKGSPHSGKVAEQAEWRLSPDSSALVYNKVYPVVNVQWKQSLVWDEHCGTGGSRSGKYCMNLGGSKQLAGFKIINAQAPCKVNHTQGQWKYVFTPGTVSKETWQVGTEKKHTSSKTDTWSESYTISVEAGFEFLGTGGKMTESTTIGHQTSNTYTDEFGSSTTHTWEVDFGADSVGFAAWQFKFTPTDTCGNKEDTLVQEYALTKGAWLEPCCLPGFHTDAHPGGYSTCKSKDTMTPNGDAYGCKVQSGPPPAPVPPTPTPPGPPAPPSPPTPGGACPGGSLAVCISACPSNPIAVYRDCVANCGKLCPKGMSEGTLVV